MNFDYVLSDEAGEIHPPKDPDRREKAMSKAMVKAVSYTHLTLPTILLV